MKLELGQSLCRFFRIRINALLMILAEVVFVLTRNLIFLIIAAIIDVISPSGNEIGMYVPTRQSYTMAVVSPDERSAASGITTIARSVGVSVSPALAGIFLSSVWLMSSPFFIAGGLKIIFDLSLYRSFRTL